MEAVQASQHVYVVKVRARPDPALLFPSERRYSALTVAGLAAGHALLGGVALLLGVLALAWDPPQGPWVGHLGAGLWLGVAALQASACGVLAWRRWYEDRYITWFFRSSILAAIVAGAGLVLTATALAHLHENVLSLTAPFNHAAPALPALPSAVADEGSGGDSSWLDLGDSNSSTISTGGVFSDLVRDQEHDLVAADSTRHEDLAGTGVGLGLASAEPAEHAEPPTGEPEWSVLRWVPVPISPRASAQVRSLVGANVLVACLLELLWSLLGARLAWRGMQMGDVDLSAPAKECRAPAHAPSAAPVPAVPAMATLKAPLAVLERGAADGKVDAEADHPADGPDGPGTERNHPKQTACAASLQRRRRAPELPAALAPAPAAGLPLDLERTMDLEERVARLVGEGAGAGTCTAGSV